MDIWNILMDYIIHYIYICQETMNGEFIELSAYWRYMAYPLIRPFIV